MMIKLLVLNGPNLNLLGLREPKLYGSRSYDELCAMIRAHAERRGIAVEIVQTNHEGVMVDRIQEARGVFDGIVLNPAAYTHTSVALRDCLLAVGIPTVEVHLTDPKNDEASAFDYESRGRNEEGQSPSYRDPLDPRRGRL